MPTRNINLTEHYDSFLSSQLEAGLFKNASEVVRAGLRLLEKERAEEEAKLEALRNAIIEGHEAYERGDYLTLDSKAASDQFFDKIAIDTGLKD